MERDIYQIDLTKNNIKLDLAQEEIMSALANLSKSIITGQNLLKAIYLYGEVGTGKTMLMELFFKHLKIGKKQKVHFHAFMLEVHELMQKLEKSKKDKIDFIKYAARYLAEQYKLIYIDELHIDDIADAMIVGRLFKELFVNKVIIAITSNVAPKDLYKDGLQRENFLPFIETIEENSLILKINSKRDYRKEKLKSLKTVYYIYSEAMDSQTFVYDSFLKITNGNKPVNRVIHFNARDLMCPITSRDCAVFTFDQLCRSPLASADYIKICEEFSIIILAEIPKLSSDEHNEAKRFIDLIDTIYDFKRILLCTSKAHIEEIYQSGKWNSQFARTISRLQEMQSEEYIGKLD